MALGLAPFGGAHAQGTSRFAVKVLGDPAAPVEIREYSSLTCPHCASWHASTLPAVKERFIDTGQARLVFRDFPLDLRAWLASAVAHCGGEQSFFAFLEVLFAEQRSWAGAPTTQAARQRLDQGGLPDLWREAGRNAEEVESLRSVAGTVNALIDLAALGGLAPNDTKQCLADFDLLDWILEAQREGSEQFNVRATPTIIVDGRAIQGAHSIDVVAEGIEAALARR